MDAIAVDSYVFDTLMRDLVGHSKSTSAFLVYLQLYRHTQGMGRDSVGMSHAVLAELSGLSKRSVQTAVAHLIERRLLRRRRARVTATPIYSVASPWVRREKP